MNTLTIPTDPRVPCQPPNCLVRIQSPVPHSWFCRDRAGSRRYRILCRAIRHHGYDGVSRLVVPELFPGGYHYYYHGFLSGIQDCMKVKFVLTDELFQYDNCLVYCRHKNNPHNKTTCLCLATSFVTRFSKPSTEVVLLRFIALHSRTISLQHNMASKLT